MRWATVCIVFVLVSACTASTPKLLLSGTPSGPIYRGPLGIPLAHARGASVVERSGAAGRALECRFPPARGGSVSYHDGLNSVASSYAQAVSAIVSGPGGSPASGYRVERTEGSRVLLTWDVDGRTKIAYLVRDGIRDYEDHQGWGIEAYASCDPAEFPERVTDAMGIGVWLDGRGERVPISRVQSYLEDGFCGYDGVASLQLGRGFGFGHIYIRDPDDQLADFEQVRYDDNATLPVDARDSGFHRDGRELWLSPGREAAYLVARGSASDVERWPTVNHRFGGCG